MEPATSKSSIFKDKRVLIAAGVLGLATIVFAIALAAMFANPANNQTTPNPPPNTASNDNFGNFFPSQTCPEEMIPGDTLRAKYNGQTYDIHGEDVAWIEANCETQTGSSSENTVGLAQYTSPHCTGTGAVNYTASMIDLASLGQIVPLGRMFDSHVTPTDHQYWQPVNMNAGWNDYQVYAPADGIITGVGRRDAGEVTTIDLTYVATEVDYRMIIHHTCDFSTIIIHLHSLPDSILNQLTFDQNGNAGDIQIPIKAGDQIGTVGGSTFDVTTVDLTKQLTGLINPDAYMEGEPWKIYTQDTIAYYTEPLKSQLYAKTSRSAEPVGGKIDFDVDGKITGNWFRQGTDGYVNNYSERYWDGHVAIAPNQHNPNFWMFSTGHFLDGKSAQFWIDPATPNPANVDSSTGIVIYDLYKFFYTHPNGDQWVPTTPGKNLILEKYGGSEGKVLLQVLPDKTLKLEIVAASSTQVTFSAAAQIYTR